MCNPLKKFYILKTFAMNMLKLESVQQYIVEKDININVESLPETFVEGVDPVNSSRKCP